MENILTYQWVLVIASSLILLFISPWSNTVKQFFQATNKREKSPSIWLLTSSLVISWIFAKSITNAANLGMNFGFVGGVAYATYYISFIVAGLVIYQMRVKGGFKSLHDFLEKKFGKSAVIVFSLLIAFRLFNEVWSNTMVIGTYFGAKDSSGYYWSIIIFTVLTLVYTLKGGLRSSLMTDLIQMVLFGVLLFIILAVILPKKDNDIVAFVSSGDWTMAGGLSLLVVAFIQSFSYPFHDPVLTDRGFIAEPKATLKSYIIAAFVGAICILLFSFVGIYAQMENLSGQAPVEVSKLLGVGMMLIMNFIMVTSAASTLDSTFNSFSKMLVVDLGSEEKISVKRGRIAMIITAVLGTLPVFFSPEILSATTVSGTMVIGLAPVFVFWNAKVGKLSFHLCVGTGILFGVLLAFGLFPNDLIFFEGKYGDLLSVNILGTVACLVMFWLGKFDLANRIFYKLK